MSNRIGADEYDAVAMGTREMREAGVRWHDELFRIPNHFNDRIDMARAAYDKYAEADGTSVIDFALDVLLFVQSEHDSDAALLKRLTKQAGREWRENARRNCRNVDRFCAIRTGHRFATNNSSS